MGIWGQVVSVMGMIAIILSFQCKSNRNLVIVMGAGALLFAISFFMLDQPSAAVFNLISVICSVVCLKDNLKNKFVFGLIATLYVVATWFTADGWWQWLLMAAQLAGSYTIMFKSGTFIRNVRFFFTSPVWLINNTVVGFSLGGIVCEIITMISILVSFIRFRKTGFEK